MPGPPGGGQIFLPQIPFGIGLDPQGGFAANLPPQIPGPPQPPIPGYVRRYAQGAGLQRRFVRPALVADPIVAPKGGYPQTPGTFVGLGPSERIRRRRFLYQTIVAPPIVAPTATFIAPPPFVANQAIERSQTRRGAPEPHLAPPVSPALTFVAPPAMVVGEGPAERIRRRRYLYSALVAPPIVAPAGGYPLTPPGTFVGLGPVDKLRRRRFLYQTIVAPPVAGTTFIAPAATIVSNHFLLRHGHRLPPQTILPPPVPFLAPQARYANFVGLGAVASAYRRRNGSVLVAPPVPAKAFVAPPATNVSQAAERSVRRRSGSVQLPRLGSPPPVKSGTFVAQAVERALTRRTPPRPHLAAPVPPTTAFVAPPALLVTDQARALTRRPVPKPHLAPPVVSTVTFVAPPAVLVTEQSGARPYTRRTVPAPHLPRLGAPKPVPAGTFLAQAVARSYTRRIGAPAPHVARPLVAAAVPFRTQGFYFFQAVERALVGRGGHVRLPGTPGRGPVPAGLFVSQALRRPLLGRGPNPKPHVAPPIVAAPVPFRSAGFLSLQAVQRTQERRFRDVVPAPHLAPRVTTPAGPGATIKLQAINRALIGRGGRVRLPGAPGRGPVPYGEFNYQAIPRSLRGRGPNPKPHLAPPIVAAVPFLAPPALIVSQGTERGWEARYRTVPAPHLAAPVRTPAGPGATLRLQAVTGRALLGRGGHVRLPSLGAPRPVPAGTFLSQALRRPYVGRTVPRPHLAAGLVTAPARPPNAPGLFVSQATQRASSLLSRRGHVRLAPPVLTRGRTPPTLVVSQALRRPYVGRRIIPAHLAPPVRTKAGPGITFRYQAVQRALTRRSVPLRPRVAPSLVGPRTVFPPRPPGLFVRQAVQRALTRRRVPVPPRYLSIVFVPSQAGIPFPVITAAGGTGPRTTPGRTAPRPTTGVTAPLAPGGTTSPTTRTGETSPREHLP